MDDKYCTYCNTDTANWISEIIRVFLNQNDKALRVCNETDV